MEEKFKYLIELEKQSIEKLDGIWAVQLFFRNFPYYMQRANNRENDNYKHFDKVISENLPFPKNLPREVKSQFDAYQSQIWAMCIVYIEAILEDFFFSIFDYLETDYKIKPKKLPRQASFLQDELINTLDTNLGIKISIDETEKCQLVEMNATRHLWIHKGGKIDAKYLQNNYVKSWWSESGQRIPNVNELRILDEKYIKSNLFFSKKLIQKNIILIVNNI
ncbi:MAG: hypothetical protein AABZ74_05495 [Cyanobacteriota bacterium]